MQAARLLRFWPTTLALGTGRSTVVMANNVARMIALPAAFLANQYWHSLLAIIAGFVVGEILAQAVALVLLSRSSKDGLLAGVRRTLMFILSGAATLGCATAIQYQAPALLVASLISGLGLMVLLMFTERQLVAEVAAHIRARFRRA